MPTIDTTTENLGLPLPHPENDLDQDVMRLIAALGALDGAMHGAQQALQAKADAETMNLALAAKADADTMGLALAAKASAQSVLDLAGQVDGLNTLALATAAAAVVKSIALAAEADLDAITASGFYTLAEGAGQLVASAGADTALQIAAAAGALRFRTGAADGAGTPEWTPWQRVALHSDAVAVATGGVMDCAAANYFTLGVEANTTLSFANIPPGGAYACVLEVAHTAGSITFPDGTAWAGQAPTLAAGKRHLFFFQRAQVGSGGWYASALAGFAQ